MKVIKIGGTALSNSKSINKFCFDLENLTSPTIVVVSALGKLSSELKYHFNSTTYSNNFTPFLSIFTDFRHLLCQKELVFFDEYTLQCQKKLTDIMYGCHLTSEYSKKSLDKILVLGELLSSYFIYCLLKSKNIYSDFLDIRGVIVTDSNFGNAKPNMELSTQNISDISFSRLTITQGFIATDSESSDTTMGFESSNLSALLLAQAVNCNSSEIYTKVNQINILDPEIYNSSPVSLLPYQSAQLLANNGFKLLFPGMIELAEKKGIEVIFKGLDNKGTTKISNSTEFKYPVIFQKRNQLIISPIKKDLAIKIIEVYRSEFFNFKYSSEDFSLIAKVDNFDLEKLQNYIISLL